MRSSFRRGVAAAILAGLASGGALAEGAGASRYTIAPSGDGFIRLDTVTGAVSHCHTEGDAWICQTAAERSGFDGDLAAIAGRVARLAEELDTLAAEIAALRARAAGHPVPPPLGPQSALTAEDERELARISVFSDRLFTRFFALVREMREEAAE